MTEPNVLIVCVVAFIAVMLLLSLLAILFALLTRLFPPPSSAGLDASVMAAVHSAAAAAYPGTRITEIKEVR